MSKTYGGVKYAPFVSKLDEGVYLPSYFMKESLQDVCVRYYHDPTVAHDGMSMKRYIAPSDYNGQFPFDVFWMSTAPHVLQLNIIEEGDNRWTKVESSIDYPGMRIIFEIRTKDFISITKNTSIDHGAIEPAPYRLRRFGPRWGLELA
jgi:hypothetical protein